MYTELLEMHETEDLWAGDGDDGLPGDLETGLVMGNVFQTLIPPLVVVPRYGFSVFSTAMITLLAIVGQHLSKFLGMIGCWAGAWAAAVCVEHLYFRRLNFHNYDLQYWNAPSRLPLGAAALGESFLSFLVVIPSIALSRERLATSASKRRYCIYFAAQS